MNSGREKDFSKKPVVGHGVSAPHRALMMVLVGVGFGLGLVNGAIRMLRRRVNRVQL